MCEQTETTKRTHTGHLNPTLERQRHLGLCEFYANLVYMVSSRTAGVTWGDPVSKKKRKKKKVGGSSPLGVRTSRLWRAGLIPTPFLQLARVLLLMSSKVRSSQSFYTEVLASALGVKAIKSKETAN